MQTGNIFDLFFSDHARYSVFITFYIILLWYYYTRRRGWTTNGVIIVLLSECKYYNNSWASKNKCSIIFLYHTKQRSGSSFGIYNLKKKYRCRRAAAFQLGVNYYYCYFSLDVFINSRSSGGENRLPWYAVVKRSGSWCTRVVRLFELWHEITIQRSPLL